MATLFLERKYSPISVDSIIDTTTQCAVSLQLVADAKALHLGYGRRRLRPAFAQTSRELPPSPNCPCFLSAATVRVRSGHTAEPCIPPNGYDNAPRFLQPSPQRLSARLLQPPRHIFDQGRR